MQDGEQESPIVDELPSGALTTRFLALRQEYGAKRLVVRVAAAGRSAGARGLTQSDDWTVWNADELRAAARPRRGLASNCLPRTTEPARRQVGAAATGR